MPDIIIELDILLNAACKLNAFQSPIKVYEYMASGRRIISARTPQVELLLDGERATPLRICVGWSSRNSAHSKSSTALGNGDSHGLTYELENPDDLAEKFIQLIRNEELVRSLAGSAPKALESQHTWPRRIESLLADLSR